MRKLITIGASAGALLVAQMAQAHSFVCEKKVNGETYLEVSSYPTTLHYTFKVTNNHPSSPSTAHSVKDEALKQFGFYFEPPAPFTLGIGESVYDSFDLTVWSYEDCLKLAAKDGYADKWFVNKLVVDWEAGSTQCSAKVVCKAPPPPPPPPPPPGEATRTPGYYKTHEQALQQCVDEGPINLGFISVDSLEEALGLLWGSPAFFENKEKRSKFDQTRFLLARHTLVATCNNRLFNTVPDPSDLITDAVQALSGNDCSLMKELQGMLDEFNNSGDDEDFPAGFDGGGATPRHAKSIADDPTTPSSEQCGG